MIRHEQNKRSTAKPEAAAPSHLSQPNRPFTTQPYNRTHNHLHQKPTSPQSPMILGDIIDLNNRTDSGGVHNVIQAQLDREDWENIFKTAEGDQDLTALVQELYDIHQTDPERFKYGKSAKGGEAFIDDSGRPGVIINDKAFTHLWTNEKDRKRQASIVHEMTHIAEMMKNNNNSLDFTAWEESLAPHRADRDAYYKEKEKKLINISTNNDLESEGQEIATSLWEAYGIDDEAKSYTRDQAKYLFDAIKYVNYNRMNGLHHEYASVFTQLWYYLKGQGLMNTELGQRVRDGALRYFNQRRASKTTQI